MCFMICYALCLLGTSPGWQLERLSSAFASMSFPWATAYLCDTLLLGANSYGVVCYDVADAARPKIFSYLPTPGNALDLKLSNRYCFVADEYQGLAVIEVSDPRSFREIGRCSVPGVIDNIAIKGDYVFATGWPGAFDVIDVSVPSAPRHVASLPTSGACVDCEVMGNFAYVVDEAACIIRVISVADPAHPVEVNQYRPPLFNVSFVYLEDTLCFCTNHGYVRILNVSDPMNIREIGVYSRLVNNFRYITKRDSLLFVIAWEPHGLFIVNVANPTNPVEIGHYITSQPTKCVVLKDTVAYVSTEHGLVVLNISDPRNPTPIDYLPIDLYYHISVALPLLYTTGARYGLKIFDVGNPRQPVLLSRTVLPDSTWSRGIAYRESLLYMGTGKGLRVFDVSDPYRPSIIGELEGPTVFEVELNGTHAYVLEHDQLAIIDISSPTQPRLVSRYSSPGITYYNLCVLDSFAYIAGDDFEVVDVNDPSQPRQVGFCRTPGDACGVGLKYPYAYVTDYGNGIAVIDISDPTSPQIVNQVPLPGLFAWGCAVADSFLYVRLGLQGIKMFSLADPPNPVEVAYYDTPGALIYVGDQIAVAGDLVFLADCHTAEILQRRFVGVREDGQEERKKRPSLSVWPTHARGRVNISFVLPAKGDAALNVYSVTGRHLKSFVLSNAGREHSIVWDGTDERGGDVPAGVYFCRLRVKDYSATKKFVLLR